VHAGASRRGNTGRPQGSTAPGARQPRGPRRETRPGSGRPGGAGAVAWRARGTRYRIRVFPDARARNSITSRRVEAMNVSELNAIAKAMVAKGKGLIAMDESGPTIAKRFKQYGI